MLLYCVYDKIAEEAGPIFCAANEGVAMRQFRRLMGEAVDVEDYQLLYLGSYDTKLCKIDTCGDAVRVSVQFGLKPTLSGEKGGNFIGREVPRE